MGWYVVIKTINGHRYFYKQRTWREGKHVRTENVYLGPTGDSGRKSSRRSPKQPASPVTFQVNRSPDTEKSADAAKELIKTEPANLFADERDDPVRKAVADALETEYRNRNKKELERERRRIERILYGPLTKRIARQKAKYLAAKRMTKGIKALNPFIAKLLIKEKKP